MPDWKPIPGETPIDDVSGLKPKWVTTRTQLNDVEAQNIRKAVMRYLAAKPSRRQVLLLADRSDVALGALLRQLRVPIFSSMDAHMLISIADLSLDHPKSISFPGCRRIKTLVYPGRFSTSQVAGEALFAGIRDRKVRGVPIATLLEHPIEASLAYRSLTNWAIEPPSAGQMFAPLNKQFSYSVRGAVADFNQYGGAFVVAACEMMVVIGSRSRDQVHGSEVGIGAVFSFDLHDLTFFLA